MTTLAIESRIATETNNSSCKPERHQQTLASAVTLHGRGLHGGDECKIIIHPAEPSTGIVFLVNKNYIPAVVTNVVDTSRGTTLGTDGTRIRTVEHLMAALHGKGIDNAVVEVYGSEMPALDGSALPYAEAIEAAGIVAQQEWTKPVARLQKHIVVQQNSSFIAAVPGNGLRITYVLNYEHPMIGTQVVTYDLSEDNFAKEIAPARTFVLYEELSELLDNDLARGGSLDNAIVIWRDRLSSRLRFPDELVRHKVMDLVGDLALIGSTMEAEIVAVKSGHALNIEFAKRVFESWTSTSR
ncbi:MAG: UDP-3-O-acyl-N-acetylglucosamine deacetylase [Armatimonadota bacterium]